MVKKNKISSSWLKREIDKKLYYSSILFTLLLCVLVAFAYSIPAVGIPIESQIQIYFQNLFSNWTIPNITIPTITPIHQTNPLWAPCGQVNGGCARYQHTYTFFINAATQKIFNPTGLTLNESDNAHTTYVNLGAYVDVDFGRVGNFHVTVTSPQNIFQCVGTGCLPHSSSPDTIFSAWVTRPGSAIIRVDTNSPEPSPTPTPTLAISVHQPNKLVITRPENSPLHLLAFTTTITDSAQVKKIFDDILQLPIFDAPGTILMKCPMEISNPAAYTLAFYQNNKLTDTAVYRTTGCATVTIDNYPARFDNGFLSSFDTDFHRATGLSGQSLYGY